MHIWKTTDVNCASCLSCSSAVVKNEVFHMSEFAGFSTVQLIPKATNLRQAIATNLYKAFAVSTLAASVGFKFGKPSG